MENYSSNKVKYAFCLLFMGLFPQENEATALSWVGLATNTYQTAEFEEENKWFASRSVYSKYAENDSLLLAAGDTIQIWFDSLAQTNIADFHELHLQTAEVMAINENAQASLKAAAHSTMMYADSLVVIDSLLQGASSMDSTLLESNRAGILNSISQIAESQRENGNLIDSTNLVAIVNNNTSLQASEQYDINQKAINAIYLSTIAVGNADFSEPQLQILIDIAYQCPITGGPAVFLARGLYDFVNAEAIYDDEGECANQGQQWRQHANEFIIKDTRYIILYPNPTDNSCNLVIPSGTGSDTYEVSIHNSVGQEVMLFTLPNHITEYVFSVANLSQGVYMFQVSRKGEHLYREKLIIIH